MCTRWFYLVPCIALTSTVVFAQDITTKPALPSETEQPNLITEVMHTQVRISPAVGSIDAKTNVTTLELTNPGTDTIAVKLTLSNSEPTVKTPAKSDTTAAQATNSLVPWVTELPAEVIIPPQSKQTVAVKLNVPKDAAAGEYVAWVQASPRKFHGFAESNNMTFTFTNRVDPFSKVVYTIK